MPRTRRTPASAPADDAAAETPVASDSPTLDTAPEPTLPDAPINSSDTAETPSSDAAPKTPRRRAPRRPRAETVAEPADEPVAEPAAEAVTQTAFDLEAPVVEAPPDTAPRRRRGRRTAALTEAAPEAAPVEASPAPTEAEISADETTTPKRRGRRTAAAPPPPAAPTVETAPPTRRRGQPRPAPVRLVAVDEVPEEEAAQEEAAQEEAAEDTAETAAAVVAGTVPETVPAPRRRGRRRGAAPVTETPTETEAFAETPAELPDVEAPVIDSELGEEPKAEGEDSKRGRRRRGGRRRGNEEPTTEMLEAAGAALIVGGEEDVQAETPDEDEDDTLLDFAPPSLPTFIAPPIVPPVLPPADDSAAPRLSASVQTKAQGLARIVTNGAAHLPYFFFVNTETAEDPAVVSAQIADAAANGIHLFSGIFYLPLRNALGERSFAAADALVQTFLRADPDGYVLPRLQCVPTNYWVRTHLDQLAKYADGTEGDVSLASTEFWADCVDALDALIAHFADPETPGGDRVLGFHLDRGEWFSDAQAGYDVSEPNGTAFQHWLHAKYQAAYALRTAWHDAAVTWETAGIPEWQGASPNIKKTDTPLYATRREGRWPDYAQFASELAAGVIAGLAAAIKTLSSGRMLVAASYGYTLEFAGRNDSGHLALGMLLDSPDIDIVAGPNSYAGRGAGSTAGFPAPVDSAALHGKLWLVEDDTKTFLAGAETDDDYNPKIASGADTQAVHQRHFGAALAHRAGVTWMDLWGQGWLNSPDIWREMGALTKQVSRWEALLPSAPAAPEVAVLVDEASLRFLKNAPDGLGASLVVHSRDLLLRAGASVGFYLQSDITRPDFPEAKLYLFLNALRLTTGERQAVRERLQKPGRTLAWLYAPGLFDENGPSPDEVGEVVGMALRPQPWNSRGGSVPTEARGAFAERLRGVKRLGTDELLNPLYAVSDPQATALAEYSATGAASLAVRESAGGWKSVFIGDPALSPELLRGLLTYAGVTAYGGGDDSVYASSDGVLTLHGASAGTRTVALPRRASVLDVFADSIVASGTRSFRIPVRARETRLLLWGDGEALARTTGLDLPEAEEAPEPMPAPAPPVRPVNLPPPARSVRVIPGLDAAETLADTEDAEDSGTVAAEDAEGNDATPARRSRWQRRRAALRAKRDAERAAKTAEGGTDDNAPAPPVDMATLLPGLPPRRAVSSAPDAAFQPMEDVATLEGIAPPEPGMTVEEAVVAVLVEEAFPTPEAAPVPADRVAEIVAADVADETSTDDDEGRY